MTLPPDATVEISLELNSGSDFGVEIIAKAHLRQLTRGHEPHFNPVTGDGDPGAPAEFTILEWELESTSGEPFFRDQGADEKVLRALLGPEFSSLERKAHELATGEWSPGPPEPNLLRFAKQLNAELSIYEGHRQARTYERKQRIRWLTESLFSAVSQRLFNLK
jgi:HAMP domain-containing protein